VGTVREVNGGPIADVAIRALTSAGTFDLVTSTTSDGSFRIDHAAFDALELRKKGYQDVWWPISQFSRLDEILTIKM